MECKYTAKKVTTLQMNKIHAMRCNQLKDRQTECNYAAIISGHMQLITREVGQI